MIKRANNSGTAWYRLGIIPVVWLLAMSRASAETVSPGELAESRRWVAAKFDGVATLPPLAPGLEVVSNYDAVQKKARFAKPLKILDQEFREGLFCHAPSEIVVRLPGPGKTFHAVLGVDTNEQTIGGRGSVVFSISVAGREVFRSDKVCEGVPGQEVNIDLQGESQFVLQVADGGDGIACDQADWADARAELADGQVIPLADLPMVGGPAVSDASKAFFSFTYGGRSSSELLPNWQLERASRQLDEHRIERTLIYTDPQTGLQIRCVGIEYTDFPTIEWTLYFKNTGATDTPILEDIQALDTDFARGHYGEFLLHHAVGSICAVNDYEPLTTSLTPAADKRISASGGRPTNSDLSYFNLEVPTAQGVIIVVGWPGQWASRWTRDADIGLRVRAGQELTHFTLHPGEEVRSPLIVMQFWQGDWIRAQNIWRRWMLAYNVPRPRGQVPQPELFGCTSHLYNEMVDATEANQKMCLDRYLQQGIGLSRWWMDAGWYPCDGVGWPKVGTWEVDSRRFPDGLRAVSDYAHAKGVKTILWFEPERVHSDTWLTKNHPEWVLGGEQGGLLNLGNPAAREWLTDHVDQLLTREGIDLYRQDFNMDPLGYWRGADSEDRQGITEIRHVEGYLAYWDELMRRHPGMWIDSCASGGRRNDLETMRRAIPLWRSDYRCEPVGTQCCSYGISLWIPLSGTGAADVDPYIFRSNMTPFTNCLFDIRSDRLNFDLLRHLTLQWKQVADCYFGDFYPLTEYSTRQDAWMAWQFHLPEEGKGFVQAFRREKCVFLVGQLKLCGLQPQARYRVTDLDAGSSYDATGQELMKDGLTVTIADQPGSVLMTYTCLD